MPTKLIITRPVETGQTFADKIRQLSNEDVDVILSPGLRIVPLAVQVPAQVQHFIFTSPNGVAQVSRLGLSRDAHAWCVGEKTAEAARDLGFTTTVGGGNAAQLLDLLRDRRPSGAILHVCGAHTKVDMAALLRQAGLQCTAAAAYDQKICAPSVALQKALSGDDPLVIPLFSARSSLTLAQTEWAAPVHVVAISQDVADAVVDWGADTVGVAAQPTEDAMVDLTCVTLDRIKRRWSAS